MLETRPELQVIGRVSDGLEAVHKAEKLQPDLIVLDIGLPSLNGIEAARQIRELSPNSKILFLSQESSADIVEEALRLGALGYVVKAHAGSELLAAVEAVSQGRQFVSGGLSVSRFTHTADTQAPIRKTGITRSHQVGFHNDDAAFLLDFTCFIQAALNAGNAVIVIATKSHLNVLAQRLQERGNDHTAAIEQGRYIPLDVADVLASFMINEMPDPLRLQKVAGALLTEAAKATKGNPPRVAVCGECSPMLWAEGKADGAIRLEHLWDEIGKAYDVDILCGYVLTNFQREHERHVYEGICEEHSTVRSH
jgi:DNA-binding NarL/FixJ family response regulator